MGEHSYLYNKCSYDRNCVTGDTDHLYVYLRESIAKAESIDIIVAFLMESGVKLLMEDFKEAVDRNAALRILCGNYLNITQPQALYLLKDFLEDKVDLRFYNNPNKSFHPKAYIFRYKNSGEIFIGSSNISRSALTDSKGDMKLAIDEDDIYESFKEFYSHPSNAIDLVRDNSTSNYIDYRTRKFYKERLEKRYSDNEIDNVV